MVNIYVFAIILIVFWLMKPLSDGVYLIWTLPSFIILAIFKNIAKNIKQNNQKDKIKLIEKKEIFYGKERISKRNRRKNRRS